MKRQLLVASSMILVVLTCGCRKQTEPAAGSSPPAAVPRGGGVPQAKTPNGAAATSPATSLEAAHGNAVRAAKRVNELLDSAKDETSARTVAPQLREAAAQLGTAMKQLKTTFTASYAAQPDTGQKYAQLAQQNEMPDLRNPVERVALGPQGPLLRQEINSILDAILEGTLGARPRAAVEKWIQDKKLRG